MIYSIENYEWDGFGAGMAGKYWEYSYGLLLLNTKWDIYVETLGL